MTDEPEDDMMREALENNRRNNLCALRPTEMRRRINGELKTWTNTTPAAAAAWVDDQLLIISQMAFTNEISGWLTENDHALDVLYKYFEPEYWRLMPELLAKEEDISRLNY